MEPLEYFRMRRSSFYAFTTEHTDDLATEKIKITHSNETIVEDAVNYITKNLIGELRYPGKSYAIAILYAHWLEQLGVGCLWHNLELQDLLGNDDPHFKHVEAPNTVWKVYEEILEKLDYYLPDLHFASKSSNEYLMMTRQYFLEEFMLTPEQRELLPFIPEWGLTFRRSPEEYCSPERDKFLQFIANFWLADSSLHYRISMTKGGTITVVPDVIGRYEVHVGPEIFLPIPHAD